MTAEEIITKLKEFETNPNMVTESIYSPLAGEYANSQMPFAETHMNYLRKHKHVNAAHYLSNLKIMITKR